MWPKRSDVSLAECAGEESSIFLEDGFEHRERKHQASVLKVAALVSAVALLTVGIWLRPGHPAESGQAAVTQASVELDAFSEEADLQARLEGIKTKLAALREFREDQSQTQAGMLEVRKHLLKKFMEDEGVPQTQPENQAPPPQSADPQLMTQPENQDTQCHTAVEGEPCYQDVHFAMKEGILEHPSWYPGLDTSSSFEEFQTVLERNAELKCAKPCPCKTAKKDDRCYSDVSWVMREGIIKHPEWYTGITETSRWEVVQARLHQDDQTNCEKPCTPKVWGTPSLFCFAIFQSKGYELGLIRSQVEKGVGIFKCDEFALLSDQELAVTASVKTLLLPPVEKVAVSKDGTAANAQIFINAWNVIHQDMRYKPHDWVVKADPDAVVLVDRLRGYLVAHTGKTTYMHNCEKFKGAGWPTMFGSLEVFSHKAIELYFAEDGRCTKGLNWTSWGEDLFMNNCLNWQLGVKASYEAHLSSDGVCKGHVDCADGVSASYHPFKSPEAWFRCYDQVSEEDVAYFKK